MRIVEKIYLSCLVCKSLWRNKWEESSFCRQSNMNGQDVIHRYLDKTLAVLAESKYEFELINLPVRYNSYTILEQIAALKLLSIDTEVQLIISIGDLAGFVGKNKKVLLYDRDFIKKLGKEVEEYLSNAVSHMKNESRYKYCFQDTQLEEWENILKVIIREIR